MKSIVSFFRSIPLYGWLLGGGHLLGGYALYLLADPLRRALGTDRWAFIPKLPVLDDLTPLIPVFVVIYIFSYVFWVCGTAAVSLTGKQHYINYLWGLLASLLVGFLFFVFAPTYIDRVAEGAMAEVQKPGLFRWMLGFIYRSDGGNLGYNLFPSLHCQSSLYCYLGVRKRPEIPGWFRRYTLVMVVLICLSTLFTRQHYCMDVVSGLAVAAICYALAQKLDPGRHFTKNKEY